MAPAIRDFDGVLAKSVSEKLWHVARLGAQKLYQALTVSDQAQMREFYLSKLEEVDPRCEQISEAVSVLLSTRAECGRHMGVFERKKNKRRSFRSKSRIMAKEKFDRTKPH